MNLMLRPMGRICFAVLFIILGLVSDASADGVYIPERAYPTLPTIPVQRAVIIHREGVETLIVESAFQSTSPEVAWILPVPAAPTDLKLLEAGAVSSTAYSLRPNIRHDLHGLESASLMVCLTILPLALVVIFIRDWGARRMTFLIGVLVLLLLIGILVPSLGSAGSHRVSADISGVAILSTQRLGNADFTAMEAAAPEAIDQWLASRGLRAMDVAARSIIADYIVRRWVFIVGVLHTTSAQLSAPLPLMATFPAATPVFPMKLTALAGSTTHVELCVFAKDQASASGFHCVIADRFLKQPWEPDGEHFPTRASFYYAPETLAALGHPNIVPLLWDNCTATKLVADMPPAKMDHDLRIEYQPVTARRDTFYSDLARRQIALSVFGAGMAIFLVAVAFVFRGRRRPTPRQVNLLLAGFLVVCTVATGVWQFLPTVSVRTFDFKDRYEGEALSLAAAGLASDGYSFKNMTPERVAEIPQLLVDRGFLSPDFLTNPFTGQPIRPECFPGNFAVRTINGKTYFCTYDENGVESRMVVQ